MSGIKRPDTMDPHDKSRKPRFNHHRGVLQVYFEEGVDNTEIQRILAEAGGLEGIVSVSQPFADNRENDHARRLGLVRVHPIDLVRSVAEQLLARYPDQ